jgi:ABC-type antimicrobial peptide transport system permease subunit
MTRLRIFLYQLWALVRSRQLDREIDDEIASHLAEATQEYVQRGLSPEEARRSARVRLSRPLRQPHWHSRLDPLTFTIVSLLLTAIAVAACYFPARRAMRLDPVVQESPLRLWIARHLNRP